MSDTLYALGFFAAFVGSLTLWALFCDHRDEHHNQEGK